MSSNSEASSAEKDARSGLFTGSLLGLAVIGAALAVEGGLQGETRHRIAALAIGAVLVLPLCAAVLLGGLGRRLTARLLVVAASATLALVVAECVVRMLDLRQFKSEELVDDPVLGHRLLPDRGEVDEWGFRNEHVPKRVQVVCIGDSQTYGVSVRAHEAWPQALARQTGLTVYNAGLGGYGPLQYLALFDQVLELQPDTIVVALYLGNDLADAYTFAALDHWSDLQLQGVTYTEPKGRRPDPRSANLALSIVDGLMAKSRVLDTLGRSAKRRLKQTAALDAVYWGETDTPGYDAAPIATRFTPDYRFEVVDLTRPAIAEGLRVMEIALGRLAERAKQEDVRLLLLLIPTKERCYRELLLARGEPIPPAVERLARAELQVVERIESRARESGLETLDPTSALVAELTADRPMWPSGPDGHFNAAGCELLAAQVASAVGGGKH